MRSSLARTVRRALRPRPRTLGRILGWVSAGAGILFCLFMVVVATFVLRGCAGGGSRSGPMVVSRTPSPDDQFTCVIRVLERRHEGSVDFTFSIEDSQGQLTGEPRLVTEDDSNGTVWVVTWRNHTVSVFSGNSIPATFRFVGIVTNLTAGSTAKHTQLWLTNGLPPLP